VIERRPKNHSISVNGMYVSTGRGNQRRLSSFAEAAKNGWIKIVVDAGQRLPPGLLALSIDIHPPDAIRRDTDGPIKLAQDAVFEAQLVLYRQAGYPVVTARQLADDYRVKKVTAERHDPDRANPRIEVRVATWGP
jgi:hypothetical protein